MGTEKPPAVDSINGATGTIQGLARDTDAVLRGNQAAADKFMAAVRGAAVNIEAQAAIARGLLIDEGAVGTFASATATAQDLNGTTMAIGERLDASAKFAQALHEYAEKAYRNFQVLDGQ